MEGKVTRVGASKPGGARVSMELVGSATRLRRGYGVPNIEVKAATGSGDMSILPPTDSSSHKVEARLNSPARS